MFFIVHFLAFLFINYLFNVKLLFISVSTQYINQLIAMTLYHFSFNVITYPQIKCQLANDQFFNIVYIYNTAIQYGVYACAHVSQINCSLDAIKPKCLTYLTLVVLYF